VKTNSHFINIEIVFDPVMALFNGVLELHNLYVLNKMGQYL